MDISSVDEWTASPGMDVNLLADLVFTTAPEQMTVGANTFNGNGYKITLPVYDSVGLFSLSSGGVIKKLGR